MTKLSYLISTYNSKKKILNTIQSACYASKKEKIKYEIIVIDDCSKDDTYKLLTEQLKKNTFLKILKNKNNLGFARSILRAAKFASGDKIKILHASNIENSYDIRKYIRKSKIFDIVLTNFIDKRNFFRRILSMFCSNMFCIFSGKKIKYFNSSILCKRNLFLKFYPKNLRGNFFLSVIISNFLIRGYKFIEVKVHQKHPKKGSKAVSLSNLFAFFHALFLVFKLRFIKK